MGTPPPIELANLGMCDSLILMVMALVVFGPRRLPEIGRQIGKLMYEFRKASNDFKFQMEEELRKAEEADRRKKEEERVAALALAAPVQTIEADSQVPEANPRPSDEDLSPGTRNLGHPLLWLMVRPRSQVLIRVRPCIPQVQWLTPLRVQRKSLIRAFSRRRPASRCRRMLHSRPPPALLPIRAHPDRSSNHHRTRSSARTGAGAAAPSRHGAGQPWLIQRMQSARRARP